MNATQWLYRFREKRFYLFLAGCAFLCDVLSKLVVTRTLPHEESVSVVEPLLRFHYVTNDELFFGVLDGAHPVATAILTVVLFAFAFTLLLLMLYFILTLRATFRVTLVGFALIFGGALGNTVERVFFRGVTDFIYAGVFPSYTFPHFFNLADVFIVAGAATALVAFTFIREDKRVLPPETHEEQEHA